MKEALKDSIKDYVIQRPYQAETSKKDVLFFDPPFEERNPELVIHSHLAKPVLKDILKEKHVPLRQYLQSGETTSQRPQSAF